MPDNNSLQKFIIVYKGKTFLLHAHNYKEALAVARAINNSKRDSATVEDERLSPMTYKKLKEMGYSSDDWKGLTQEQANKIVNSGAKESATATATKRTEVKPEVQNSTQTKTNEVNAQEYEDSLLRKYNVSKNDLPKPKKPLAVAGAEELWGMLNSGVPVSAEDIENHPVIKKVRAQLSEKLGKLSDNGIAENETININTPEREKLRQAVADKILNTYGSVRKYKDKFGYSHMDFGGPVKREYRAEIVIGPPAAGKSSVIVNKASQNTGSVVLDSDEVKKLLPEFDNGNGAGLVHKESADDILEKRIVPQFYKGGSKEGTNLIIPIVGKKPRAAMQYFNKLKEAGYDVHLSYNELPPDKSIYRATTRFLETGRFLDPMYIQSVADSPSKTYDYLKQNVPFDSFTRYNNDVEFGKPAKKVERVDANGNNLEWEDWQ